VSKDEKKRQKNSINREEEKNQTNQAAENAKLCHPERSEESLFDVTRFCGVERKESRGQKGAELRSGSAKGKGRCGQRVQLCT
jgi:hypothetical protein